MKNPGLNLRKLIADTEHGKWAYWIERLLYDHGHALEQVKNVMDCEGKGRTKKIHTQLRELFDFLEAQAIDQLTGEAQTILSLIKEGKKP